MKKRIIGFSVLFLSFLLFVGVKQDVIGELKTIKDIRLGLEDLAKKTGNKISDLGKKAFEKTAEIATDVIEKTEKTFERIAPKIVGKIAKPLKKSIKKKQRAIRLNPYVNTRAVVRMGSGPLSLEARKSLKKRKEIVDKTIEKMVGFTIPEKYKPITGISGSGGGLRAAQGTIAALSELELHGWLDFFTYITTLSGSGWAVWPLLVWMAETGGTIEQYRDRFLSIAGHGPRLWSASHIKGIADLVLRSIAYDKLITLADFYGAVLASIYFHGFGENNDPQQVYMDSLQNLMRSGKIPFPIMTVLSSPDLRWYTVNMFEFGSSVLGLFIPIWAWGRRFFNGKQIGSPPFMARKNISDPKGMSSFAMGVSFQEVYHYVLSQLLEGFPKKILKILLTELDFKRIRPLYGQEPNPWRGIEGLPVYDEYEKNKTYTKAKTINFTDPGVAQGNPVPPYVQMFYWNRNKEKGKRPLIVLMLEFSADIGYEPLKVLKDWMGGKNADGIVYSKLDLGRDHKLLSTKSLSILKNDDMLFIYMPWIKDEEIMKKYKDDPVFKKLSKNISALGTNSDMFKFYSTFKLKYKRKDVENFMSLIRFNIYANLPRINEEIKKFMINYIRRNDKLAYEKIKREMVAKGDISGVEATSKTGKAAFGKQLKGLTSKVRSELKSAVKSKEKKLIKPSTDSKRLLIEGFKVLNETP